MISRLFRNSSIRDVNVGGVSIRIRQLGSGPPLLLLHGHPQTHAIWHRVAPELGQYFSLILADLRGYGDSTKPKGDSDHQNYSKRVMAQDMVHVMDVLGYEKFAVLAHDRGARVAHRLALDHPNRVTKMVLLDIAPTLAMYEQTSDMFARLYWHWFFLIQPSPTSATGPWWARWPPALARSTSNAAAAGMRCAWCTTWRTR